MSGQPTKAPSDAEKFRKEYLDTLELEAKNNDLNLQANKIFKRTGFTPTQQMDFRTTAEKLADIERLKIELRGDLSQIADGQQSNIIVNALSDGEMRFLIQHIPEIVSNLRPKYKYGILASLFLPFFRQYMTNSMMTNEVPGVNGLVNEEVLGSLRELLTTQRTMNNMITNSLMRDIDELMMIIPTREDLEKIALIQDANTRQSIREELMTAMDDLPTKQQLLSLVRDLGIALQVRDEIQAERIAKLIHQILTIDPATREQVAHIQTQIDEYITQQGQSERREPARKPSAEPSGELSAVEAFSDDLQARRLRDAYKDFDTIPNKKVDKRAYLNTIVPLLKGGSFAKGAFAREYGGNTDRKSINEMNLEELDRAILRVNSEARVIGYGDINTKEVGRGFGGRIRGRGLVNQTDYDSGIMPTHKYSPFGKYQINRHKLNDDILAVRRNTGTNISGFPVQRLGKDLGGVLRSIVGGGQPSFHQLEKLSDEEKIFLHKLAKRVDIADRISIPTPNKDDDDKDANQFEIMKGEILNGNDSAELVKKFKILIMKMVRKDLLPKGQAKELLMELAGLGY